MAIAHRDKRESFVELWQHCQGPCGLVKPLDAFAFSYGYRLHCVRTCKLCFNLKYGNPEGRKQRTEFVIARRSLSEFRRALQRTNGKPRKSAALELQCPYCQCRAAKRFGHFGKGLGKTQRFFCHECLRTFCLGRVPLFYRGIDLTDHHSKTQVRVKYAIDLLIMGMSQRQTCQKAGLQKWTVHFITQKIKAAGLMPTHCSCGGPAGHKGWCKDRFQRSARRQAALAKLHARQRGAT